MESSFNTLRMINYCQAKNDRGFKNSSGAHGAFTIIEVLVVITLLSILILAALNSMYAMDRAAQRQSYYTAALALTQGKIEEVKGYVYNPPTEPFGASNYVTTSDISLSLADSGTSQAMDGTMTTTYAAKTEGHLITVSVTVSTPYGQDIVTSLESMINGYSNSTE